MKKYEKVLLLMLLAFLVGNAVFNGNESKSCARIQATGIETVLSLTLLQQEVLRISTCEMQATMTEEYKQ